MVENRANKRLDSLFTFMYACILPETTILQNTSNQITSASPAYGLDTTQSTPTQQKQHSR